MDGRKLKWRKTLNPGGNTQIPSDTSSHVRRGAIHGGSRGAQLLHSLAGTSHATQALQCDSVPIFFGDPSVRKATTSTARRAVTSHQPPVCEKEKKENSDDTQGCNANLQRGKLT